MPISTPTCGLTVRRMGSWPEASARSHSCTRASPRIWAAVRVSPAHREAAAIDSRAVATFSPPTGSRTNVPVNAAAEQPGHRQRPALGGVGFGAVGVEVTV